MRTNPARPATATAALAATALGLALGAGACADAATRTGAPDLVHVVAAENFWGNITSQLGGRDVKVTSLVTSPNADPHLFETDAADAATLAQAQVVIENGAGYDTWMSSLLSADGGSPRIVNAATVLHVTGSDPNPHLWYDIPRVPTVAAAIAAALEKAAPRDTATFKANLAAFDASLAPLDATLAGMKAHFHNVPVAYTERVPGYALAVAGLDVVTPSGFARSIEDGTDPSPADTLAMQRLLDGRDINVLLYNVQTVTPVTTQIRNLARQHHIPVVGVSETMPAGAETLPAMAAVPADGAVARARGEPQPVTVPPVELQGAAVRLGARQLWSDLDLTVAEGEFLAVLGPNGAGKTTLLKVLLGLVPLSAGTVRVNGAPPRLGNHELGYVPQQQAFDRSLPIRGRDLVRFGVDGHHWGLPRHTRAVRARVDEALEAVGASAFADAPVGLLSGGEQQRLRIAQALLGDPRVLLCDEPLLALDLASQRAVTRLIDERRREAGTPVVFVTHEVNPVLPYVDRILYLVRGRWAIGTPEEILTSERLSDLYGIEVDVIKVRDRYLVVSAEDELPTEPGAHPHHGHAH